MHDYKKVLEIINQNTFIENVNKGVVQPPYFFGATKSEGMAYSKGSLYNKENTLHADMTKSQSNYMDIRRCL